NGFVHLTHLAYLRHHLDTPLAAPVRLAFQRADVDGGTFVATLMRTYEGTLDCPEINDVRTSDEILDGHRGQGRHDPALWWLATLDGLPAGVVLLTVIPDSGEWDVAYVGVVPELRRRGLGRELMLRVLGEARAASVPGVTLSVDGRNGPAWELY